MAPIVVVLPLRLVSEANRREHWAPRAKRARGQRGTVRLAVRAVRPSTPYYNFARYHVTIVRIAPRKLDGDNLQRSCKAVRDGVADALGIDDGSNLITWHYDQERGAPKSYGVRITIQGVR